MKTFQEILEGKTKTDLPEIPAIKKPAKAKTPTKREEIPGLGTTIAEASNWKFADSADAANYMDSIEFKLKEVISMASDKRFVDWCAITDKNFGTNTSARLKALIKTSTQAMGSFNTLQDEMDEAS